MTKEGVLNVKHRKFIKQLMAQGLDRNGAGMCAAFARHLREPYADGLARFQRIMDNIREVAA